MKLLYEFLMGLDSAFSTIKTQILASKPTPTLGTAYHLIIEDEQQRVIATTKKLIQEADAFQSFAYNHREMTNDSNTQRVKNTTKEEHYTFCGKNRHNKDGCFKKIGYPEWWPGKGKKEKGRPKAALADTKSSPTPGLTSEQYQKLIKHFSNEGKVNMANIAGPTDEELDWRGSM